MRTKPVFKTGKVIYQDGLKTTLLVRGHTPRYLVKAHSFGGHYWTHCSPEQRRFALEGIMNNWLIRTSHRIEPYCYWVITDPDRKYTIICEAGCNYEKILHKLMAQ